MLKEAISYSIDDCECVRIIQVTDTHLFADPESRLLGINTARSFDAVLNTIKAINHPANLVLATGDISQDYSNQSYNNFVNSVNTLDLPCHYLPGNHDDPRIMQLYMQGSNIYAERRVLVGNWQIIMLDSTIRGKPGGHIAPCELELIDAAIADQPDRQVLLVMHHNPVVVNCKWLDEHSINNGDELLEKVAKIPQVKGLLWGHVHQSLDQSYQGQHGSIRLMATPSTCIQFKPESMYFAVDGQQPGYRLLELKANGDIVSDVYRVSGNEFSATQDSKGY